MSKFLSKTFLLRSLILTTSTSPPNNIMGFLRNPIVFPLRWLSSSSDQQSFTVSYLKSSLGFSTEAALSASCYVNFKTYEKPDKFINLLKNHGFSQTQISSLFRLDPRLLLYDAEKTILPKLKFFEAKGISGPEMAKMLSVFPNVLRHSLENQIIPSYDFIRSLVQSDEIVITAIKRFPDILVHNVDKYVAPNVDILREYNVPDSNVAILLKNWPKVFVMSPNRFRKTVEKAEEMGFDASKGTFVVAVYAILSMSESTWERKVDAYKKWGWSQEEVLKAFQSNPSCMKVSEDKIVACMDYFINQMGWTPCLMAKCPTIFTLSLKKRVVPRCSVIQVLLSKGLVEKEVTINSILLVSEERFLQKFIAPYGKEAPELLKLYKGKVDSSSGSESDD